MDGAHAGVLPAGRDGGAGAKSNPTQLMHGGPAAGKIPTHVHSPATKRSWTAHEPHPHRGKGRPVDLTVGVPAGAVEVS